jgi:hypothetical protein
MECYTITKTWAWSLETSRGEALLSYHHHAPGAHPVTVPPSILRLSAWERLAFVAVVVACLWAAVLWAMA